MIHRTVTAALIFAAAVSFTACGNQGPEVDKPDLTDKQELGLTGPELHPGSTQDDLITKEEPVAIEDDFDVPSAEDRDKDT